MKKLPILSMSITLAVNIVADRITKFAAVEYLRGRNPISFLGDLVVIGYAENSGAFLSMGSTWPSPIKYLVLLILPIIVCLTLLAYCLFKERDLFKIILMTSFVAGGLSNLIDRLINDFQVVDFLNFGIGQLRTGVLNVADLSITFAAVLYIIYELRTHRRPVARQD
ncbi:MAG: hypothetical protein A2087_05015 [Spirochaetes bacterium GWD1_61_31]|nr:MAG: hypothetical protein A2Y37_00045 [Spirochaetes bacterium GWB1_60_80]OHD30726.1 MAG: hypothetical protein A2004_07180 [Spirochaetes bacterium GWC1_61_12]OHD42381.1 MAG: hypothetical protein A2087_05015 [Spirochaetes bacterium GWD1_61_31]OHD42678.1 MAG: hypothetical protein A2Y35_12250 [Spirochaetes bacterium GWE1_60_18]OHD58559.1 MAG: hypothetical protein A2Y32_08830 [Spirochaetes bacterium GWF1_60_12]HAP43843.1 signal peptidase II [Spirochaetaceae bacterium]